MKIIQHINQHIPIWSILNGDHALREEIKLLNSDLLTNPDFSSPLENRLRLEVFKSKRDWIYSTMGKECSFSLIQFSVEELKYFKTCFSVDFLDFVNHYKFAHDDKNSFEIDRSKLYLLNLKKDYNSVEYVYKIMKKLNSTYKERTLKDVLDTKKRNQADLSTALNRSFIMKEQSSFRIMDGTHRLTSYYWSKILNKNKNLPKNLYAFSWVEK